MANLAKKNTAQNTSLAVGLLEEAGQAANAAAARRVFADYAARKSPQTNRRNLAALDLFAAFLAEAGAADGLDGQTLASEPAAWRGVTWGLVQAWVNWLLLKGYAAGTVNVRLASVRTYARLAMQAGAIPAAEYAAIAAVKGLGRKEARRVDDRRKAAGLDTRRGAKGEPRALAPLDVEALAAACDDTPAGRRDLALIRLLADLGLRIGEAALITFGGLDLAAGQMRIYRPKVDKVQVHELPAQTLAALRAVVSDLQAAGVELAADTPIWARYTKGGRFAGVGMTAAALAKRVRVIGQAAGVEVSPHDLRHYWATRAAAAGTPIDRLQEAGGWSSYAMPLRYIQAAAVANKGVKLA